MTEVLSSHVVNLLITEAWDLYDEDRYGDALSAAHRAVQGAEQLDDLALRIRSSFIEAECKRMIGDKPGALARLSWILGVTEDPAQLTGLGSADISWEVADAFTSWTESAEHVPEIPIARLFEVLDAGERYVRRIGKPDWRSGLLAARSRLLWAQELTDQALDAAEEALALNRRDPSAPGPTLACHLWWTGDLLRQAGRLDDAEGHYEEVLAEHSSSAYDSKVAHQGLARCAIEQEDYERAKRHARRAVQLAEGMGDELLCPALDTLIDALREAKDYAKARAEAERHVAVARGLSELRLFSALRNAVDAFLDLEEISSARAFIEEALPIAETLDRQRGVMSHSEGLTRRLERLTKLQSRRQDAGTGS